MNISDVIETIISVASSRDTVLGTELGKIVAETYPELRSDPTYRLKQFIVDNCAHKIAIVGTHKGGDDIYKFIPEGTIPTPKPVAPQSLWEVFQRPNSEGKIFLDTSTGQPRVASLSDSAMSIETEIRPISHLEHREIASDFISNLSDTDRPHFEAALSEDDYWPKWSKLINSPQHKLAWGEFRFKNILAKLDARLAELDLEDHSRSNAKKIILESRNGSALKKSLRSKSKHSSSELSPENYKQNIASLSKLRESAHLTIEKMSESDLRRIWLPFGVCFDAINSTRDKSK